MVDGATGDPRDTTPAEPAFDRNAPAFKAVTAQVEEQRRINAELQAKLDEILDKEKKIQAEAERKALEEKGAYETVLKQKDAEIDAIRKAQEKAALDSALKIALLSAGVTNDVFLNGAVAGYAGDTDSIAQYVEELKASDANKLFFGQATRPGIPPAQGGAPASSTAVDWTQIRKNLTDPKEAAAAQKALTDFAAANNGKLPPGF